MSLGFRHAKQASLHLVPGLLNFLSSPIKSRVVGKLLSHPKDLCFLLPSLPEYPDAHLPPLAFIMDPAIAAPTPALPTKLSVITSKLSQTLYEELVAVIKGKVYRPNDAYFGERAKLFNGNVMSASKAVACPLDAEDISQILLFCSKHALSLSVKAGGYGTGGWAINGDIIIDLSSIDDVDIEPPQAEGGFTSIRDMAPPRSKGKTKAGAPSDDLPPSTVGSAAVASFLHGPPLPPDDSGEHPRQPPANRRRLDDAGLSTLTPVTSPAVRQISTDSSLSQSSLSPDSVMPTSDSTSTVATTPSGSNSPAVAPAPTPRVAGQATGLEPFSYMSGGPTTMTTSSIAAAGPSVNISSVSPASTFLVRQDPFTYTAPGSSAASASALSSRPDPFAYMSETSSRPFPQVNSASSGSWDTSASFSHPLFNTSAPDSMTRAEPVHKHAHVTFGAGAKQKEVDLYTSSNPLEAVTMSGGPGVVPYHVPFSAHPVGSSVMILGGFGFLSRLYGLSIDNLVEVEMVLADGSIVIVNEREHSDLWWGIRGAGTTLGVATRYKARAYPVPVVFAGNLVYRFHRSTAASLIRHFRDCVKGAPRELYANVLLTAGPADKDSLVVIQICYVGPKEKGQEYLQAISSWTGERCLLNEVDEKSFLNQQDSVAQVLRAKDLYVKSAGRQWFIRSSLITSLPDDIVNKTVIEFADTPIGCTWLFELAGGAIADFEDNCVPKAQREASFTIAALHQWDMGIDDPRCVETAEEWLRDTIGPVTLGGPIPSFLGRHEQPSRAMASYGENWSRLVDLKKKYDPQGVFRNTFWPLDKDGQTIEPQSHEPLSP
ncbi:hypothetical protein EW146_g2635 [Bondarzewia mesenterica]|uniref:FAD-binding PCMH-type domain-containing protein n=1 Tax=Bondarzewia mesenterica TaxID=1095465 RepID=A0A4S4M1V8_9AGAM|nr:hypothetical protein EW146_g2635 [Bondarzewia mesenterica]